MNIRIGIDTGGTFTDLVSFVPGFGWKMWKVPSTPEDPSAAIITGLNSILSEYKDCKLEIVHGTTVGTNAFLERKGARTALITTSGVEDIIFIGRQHRAKLYDFAIPPRREIVSPSHILGLKERINAGAEVLTPLSRKEIVRLRGWLRDLDVESVAVSFLHSYKLDTHELMVAEALKDMDLHVSLSSEILREFREFERTSTTLINAYLAPTVSSYIDRLYTKMSGATLLIQQSNGGCIPAVGVGSLPVSTLLSGPAGGVLAAFKLAQRLGLSDIITLDMGGTSTDVSLCPGELTYTRGYHIEGYPIALPMLDIHTVGAGGGSVAWVDKGGLLRVGPQSAGADPGPACYGRGTEPTVTDANLFLGRLSPERFLGGRMQVYPDKAAYSLEKLGKSLSLPLDKVAEGILKVVNTNMVKAIRQVSLERGYDPRDFVLVCFGGASGLHAAELAEDLGMKKILFPSLSGVFSAQGMASADIVIEASRSILGNAPTRSCLDSVTDALREVLVTRLKRLGLYGYGCNFEPVIEVRYIGQSFELEVPLTKDWQDVFLGEHKRLYGYALDAPLEITSVRMRARIPRYIAESEERYIVSDDSSNYSNGCSDSAFDMIYIHRTDVMSERLFKGPGIIFDDFTTIYVPSNWCAEDVGDHNILMSYMH